MSVCCVLQSDYLNQTSQITELVIEPTASHVSIVAVKIASICNPWLLPVIVPLSQCALVFKEAIQNRSFSEVLVGCGLTGLFAALAYGACSDYAVIAWSSELYLMTYTTISMSEYFRGVPPPVPGPVAKAVRAKVVCEKVEQ